MRKKKFHFFFFTRLLTVPFNVNSPLLRALISLIFNLLQKHRPIFLQIFRKISLVDLLIDEIKIRLRDENYRAEKEIYEELFVDLEDLNISVSDREPEYLRDQILNPEPKVTQDIKFTKRRRNPPTRPIIPSVKCDKREALQKCRNFIDNWKAEVISYNADRKLFKSESNDSLRKTVPYKNDTVPYKNDSDSDTQLSQKIYQDIAVRDKNYKKLNKKQNPSTRKHDDVTRFQRLQQDVSHDLENLHLSDSKSARKSDARSKSEKVCIRSLNEESDLDFENSVLAYRSAKQRGLKIDPSAAKNVAHHSENTKKNFKTSRQITSSSGRSPVSTAQRKNEDKSSSDPSCSSELRNRNKKEIERKTRDHCPPDVRDRGLIVEKFKKFEPKTIKF